MCEIKEGFKLCTCGEGLQVSDADWKLLRLKPLEERFKTIGQVIGDYSLGHDERKIFILTEMNKRNCFDFEYDPMEDDLLYLKNKERDKTNIFKYHLAQWNSEMWGSLDHEQFNHCKMK